MIKNTMITFMCIFWFLIIINITQLIWNIDGYAIPYIVMLGFTLLVFVIIIIREKDIDFGIFFLFTGILGIFIIIPLCYIDHEFRDMIKNNKFKLLNPFCFITKARLVYIITETIQPYKSFSIIFRVTNGSSNYLCIKLSEEDYALFLLMGLDKEIATA